MSGAIGNLLSSEESAALGPLLMGRCHELARFSEQADGLTRVVYTPQHVAANDRVAGWMRAAGMDVRVDAVGNVIGRYEGERPGLPCLMLGSHLDTVRNAGKYDGMLGVVTPIACVDLLHRAGRRLPFAIEIIGFAEEEGVRFRVPLFGSRGVAGTFDPAYLELRDGDGITLGDAMRGVGLNPAAFGSAARRREDVIAYVELHIEQGPVLEAEGLPIGAVTAINGQSRFSIEIEGESGHAGTVPMNRRRDALAAAAELVLAVERICSGLPETVGTVGQIAAQPGAGNIIPGLARLSLDVRAPVDKTRQSAVAAIEASLKDICARRGLTWRMVRTFACDSCPCAPWLMDRIAAAIAAEGIAVRWLPSGAGHDGMAMIALTDIAMIFLRCKGGISHHPAESVTAADAETGARVLLRFIEDFDPGARDHSKLAAPHPNPLRAG